MSTSSHFLALPRELRDMIYHQCEIIDIEAHGNTRWYTSDSLRALRLSCQQIKDEVDGTTKPYKSLAVTTNIFDVLAFSPVMGSTNNPIPTHKLDTLVIPTGISDMSSDKICPRFDSPSTYPDGYTSAVRAFKDLTVIGVDHRVAISPDDPAFDYEVSRHPIPEDAVFRGAYRLASSIAGVAGAVCTLYVKTDRKDWSGEVVTCAGSHTALIWQGASASVPDFLPAHTVLTPIDHTFLLDVTNTLATNEYQTESLIGEVTKLCQDQYRTISAIGPAGQDSHVQIHLTVNSADTQAVTALESCRTELENLGLATKPEDCDGTVKIKVGGKHSAAPGGYRVRA